MKASNIEFDDRAHELATSPEMQPYLQLHKTLIQGADSTVELEAIRHLPVEKRYVWRVASALKWGFADFDGVSASADRETMTPADFSRVMELLRFRPIQFCLFLKALVGQEAMEQDGFGPDNCERGVVSLWSAIAPTEPDRLILTSGTTRSRRTRKAAAHTLAAQRVVAVAEIGMRRYCGSRYGEAIKVSQN